MGHAFESSSGEASSLVDIRHTISLFRLNASDGFFSVCIFGTLLANFQRRRVCVFVLVIMHFGFHDAESIQVFHFTNLLLELQFPPRPHTTLLSSAMRSPERLSYLSNYILRHGFFRAAFLSGASSLQGVKEDIPSGHIPFARCTS